MRSEIGKNGIYNLHRLFNLNATLFVLIAFRLGPFAVLP